MKLQSYTNTKQKIKIKPSKKGLEKKRSRNFLRVKN